MNDHRFIPYYNEPSHTTTAVGHLARVGGFLALLLLCAFCASAQTVNIPDANFKDLLVANLEINTNEDAEIQVSEAEAFTGLLNATSAGIADMTGIEAFVNITGLFCYNNLLTSLDVSSNTALINLRCNSNKIASLDVSKNTNLENLECQFNQLTSLTTNGASALANLICYNNQLVNLDLSGNLNLNKVSCMRNQLSTLIIGTNLTLETLSCSENKLTTLDVSGAPNLVSLGVGSNELTSLNMSTNDTMIQLLCSENQLETLDLSGCTALTILECEDNKLTQLDLSKNSTLYRIRASDNELTDIDISSNTLLEELRIANNKLSSLDLSGNPELKEIEVSNNLLTNLDLSANPVLWGLDCRSNELTTLDLSKNPLLEILVCSNRDRGANARVHTDTRLGTAKISGAGNKLKRLDLSANNALKYLDCASNQLTHLDLRSGNNSALNTVFAEDNLLTCILVDDVEADASRWTKDMKTTYCSDTPTAVALSCDWEITNQSPVPVTVTFDEMVSGFELSDIDVSNGTVANLRTTDQITYTVELHPMAEGMVLLNLEGQRVENERGDPNEPAHELKINYDITPPTALIFTSSTTQTPVIVTVRFSEEVKGFELADLILVNGSVDKLETADQKNYTLELTPQLSGLLSVDLAASQVSDFAGNGNLEAPPFAIKYGVIAGWLDEEQSAINLYPNPTVYQIHLQTTNGLSVKDEIQIVLTDLEGKLILNEKAQFDEAGLMAIDLVSYPPGVYLMQVLGAGHAITKKVIKK